MKFLPTLFLVGLMSIVLYSTAYSQNADLLKQQRIEKNPTEYINMGGKIDLAPNFNSVQEKQAWLNNQGAAADQLKSSPDFIIIQRDNQVRTHNALPQVEGFPALKHTGDAIEDNAIYDQLKQAWISKHQAKYNSMILPDDQRPIPAQERLKKYEPSQPEK